MTGISRATGRSDGTEVRETAHAALSNLIAVLALAESGRIRCSEKTRRPSAVSVEAVTEVLEGGDFYGDASLGPIAAFAWPLLVQAGGLVELNGARLHPSARGRAVMAAPSYAALGALWRRWLAKAPIDEFSRVEAIKGQRKAATLTAAVKRRAGIGLGLAHLPVGEWLDIEGVFRALRRHPEIAIARSDRAAWNLYLEDQQYGSMGYDGFGTWEVLEGRYAMCVMFEYAATLGLLDVSYRDPEGARSDFRHLWGADDYGYLSRYDGLAAVRVNLLGDAVLHARPTEDLGLPAVAPVGAQPVDSASVRRPVMETTVARTGTRSAADRAIVAALADHNVLRVFAAVVAAAGPDQPDRSRPGVISYRYLTVTGIAENSGLAPAMVTDATTRLAAVGVLTCDGDPSHGWRVNPDAFTV